MWKSHQRFARERPAERRRCPDCQLSADYQLSAIPNLGSLGEVARYNTDSLDGDPTPQEQAEFKQRSRRGDYGTFESSSGEGVLLLTVLLLLLLFFGIVIFPLLRNLGDPRSAITVGVFGAAWLAVVVALPVRYIPGQRREARRRARGVHLARFAQNNGLEFRLTSTESAYLGCLFTVGHSGTFIDHVRSADGLLADCGQYRYPLRDGSRPPVHLAANRPYRSHDRGANRPTGRAVRRSSNRRLRVAGSDRAGQSGVSALRSWTARACSSGSPDRPPRSSDSELAAGPVVVGEPFLLCSR